MTPGTINQICLCLDNLINGNIKDAKKEARRFKHHELREIAVEYYGFPLEKATLAADLLKGRDCWQLYCDAK